MTARKRNWLAAVFVGAGLLVDSALAQEPTTGAMLSPADRAYALSQLWSEAKLDLIATSRVPGPTARARENRSNYRAYGVEAYVRGTAWREMDEPWFHDPAPGPKFSGPVVLLTSSLTFSAAEDFAVFTSNLPNVTRIGQTTAGSTGNSIRVELPGGLIATICAERHAWPDGREYVGVGILPHVAVEPTIADIRTGRDTILETARRHLERELRARRRA